MTEAHDSTLVENIIELQVLPLADATNETLFGGKAAGLAQVITLGIPVPDGFVISNSAFEAFIKRDNLRSRIDTLTASLSLNNYNALKKASMTIADWILATPIPSSLLNEISNLWKTRLNNQTLIVRSSAVGEDSNEASFAGQLDSILDVKNDKDLHSAILKCWASYWSERSIAYQLSTGKQLQGMGILIQVQINSKLAGVLFTQSPTKDENITEDFMLVEYCLGQGISLVSGEINPGRFRIFKHDRSFQELAKPEQANSNGVFVALHSTWISSLTDAAETLETFHRQAQDVEWAVDQKENLFIVQSRPIVSKVPPVTNEPRESNAQTIIWSNANVQENFPDPVTPLLYSVASVGYTHYFRNLGLAFGISQKRIKAMDGALQSIIGVHGARIYYNLSSIHSVIRMAPFGEWLIKYFNSFVGATETPASSPTDQQFSDKNNNRLFQWLEVSRIAVKTSWQFPFLERRVKKFETTVSQFAEKSKPSLLDSFDVVELRNQLRGFIDIRLNQWTNASLADTASMICYGLLNTLLKKYIKEDHAALTNNLLKGVTGLVSSEPVMDIWDLSRIVLNDESLKQLFSEQSNEAILARLYDPKASSNLLEFSKSFNAYLEKWGFRCSGELMLTVPSFQEDPAGLIEIIRTYLDVTGMSPADVLQEQKKLRETQTADMYRQIQANENYSWFKRKWLKQLLEITLNFTQKSVSLRERARLKQALLYSRLRRIALTMGERFVEKKQLECVEDIFFLSYQEIDDLSSSREMFANSVSALVAQRRQEHARLSKMTPPDSFSMKEGEYLRVEDCMGDEFRGAQNNAENILKGVTACGGKVSSRATVLQNVSESSLLDAGDILITTQTDPGWAHVFFLIKGLVIERGGMLSHGAILAREFGIPAVVGVPQATKRIPQHTTIFLDADRGQVHVSEK